VLKFRASLAELNPCRVSVESLDTY